MESQQVLLDVPSAGSAAAAEQTQKFTLPVLTAMVVGSMVGAGIFSLPRAFATATGPFGAIIAWAIGRVQPLSAWIQYLERDGVVVWLQHRRPAALPRPEPAIPCLLFQSIRVIRHFRAVERELPHRDNAPLVRDDRRRKPTQPDMGTDGCRRIRDPGRLVGWSGSGATVG
jgi:hypothetical protein